MVFVIVAWCCFSMLQTITVAGINPSIGTLIDVRRPINVERGPDHDMNLSGTHPPYRVSATLYYNRMKGHPPTHTHTHTHLCRMRPHW